MSNSNLNLNSRLSPLMLALLTVFPLQLQAQSSLENHRERNTETADFTERMVITGSYQQQAIAELASTMWVIDQQQLAEEINRGADLKTALGRLVPSFDFSSDSRTNFGQNLRGRSALFMIDGVSLNSTRAISRQLDSINPFNIARIEVLSGATALYGAGAAGGIINLITKKASSATPALEALASVRSGFNDSDDGDYQVALAFMGGTEAVRGRFSLAYQDKGALFNADEQRVMPDITQTDVQFTTSPDLMLNLEFTPTTTQRLSLTGQYYKNEQDTEYGAYLGPNLAGLFGFPELISLEQGLQLADQPYTERSLFNGQYQHQDLWGQTFLAQVFYREETMQFFPFPALYQVSGSPLPAETYPLYGASMQETQVYGVKGVFHKAWQDLKLDYGLDAQWESFHADQRIYDTVTALASGGLQFEQIQQLQRYPDIDTNKTALFAQANWQLNKQWAINGGVRYQYIEHKVGDMVGVLQQHLAAIGAYQGVSPDTIEGGKSDYREVLFNLGAIYQLDENKQFINQQLWANVSQGFELPDPAKYYGNGTYVDLSMLLARFASGYGDGPLLLESVNVADNKLSGVKTDSFELGWRGQAEQWQAQTAIYYSISDKTTTYDPQTLAIVVNDDQKRVYGLEASLRYDFTQQIYSGLQAHFLESEGKNNGDWQALTAEEASPSSAVWSVGYDNQRYGAELQLQLLDDYRDDQQQLIDGYSLVNLTGYYQLSQGRLGFGIQNLLNEDYQSIWSQRAQILYRSVSAPELFAFEGRGRSYALSYQLQFDL